MIIKIRIKVFCLIALLLGLQSCKKEQVPTVITTEITAITGSSANSGGTITDEGSGTVIERGICWSKGTTPTTSDFKTIDGGGAGSFKSTLTNLDPAYTYYVRAYGTNNAGTGYGMAMSFTTMGEAPSASTQPATEISVNSATLNGTVNPNFLSTTISFEYGETSEYGQTISSDQNPIIGSTNTNISAKPTGLSPGTTYHYRVKTENSLGTVFGGDMTFLTLGEPPSVLTQEACCIRTTIATLNGTVNANFLSTTVTFEYGTTSAYGHTVPATPNVISGNTSTNVNAALVGLTINSLYHFRIKAENVLGVRYGSDLTFTTDNQIILPDVTTSTSRAVSSTSIVADGIVSADGGSLVSQRGVCYNLSGNPTIHEGISFAGTGTGAFSCTIEGLSPNTSYHLRAFATNSDGTAYGNDVIVNTDPVQITDIDGNSYSVIRVGEQLWMKENLKAITLNDNTPITNITGSTNWSTASSYGYCLYNNLQANEEIYGTLYNWHTINSGRICPSGWHVPTDDEWYTLVNYLGGENPSGGKLKEEGTAHWQTPNTGATNESDFTALPGGWRRGDNGNFEALGVYGYWWTSSRLTNPWYRRIWYNDDRTYRGYIDPDYGLSVRCIKD